MSHQSAHHHSLLNSIQQIHHHPHQHNTTAPINPENDSDEKDVVFLSYTPKVPHTPENYDPECQCSTCQLLKKLLEDCTCGECTGQHTNQVNQTEGQVVQNVPIANAVSPTNAQPSSSSIQNNDAPTSEHTNANDLDDDRELRSSTTDYLPRFFDDESGVLSSDDTIIDCEDNDSIVGAIGQDDMELDQESGNDDDDGNRNYPEYTFDDNEDDDSVDDGDDQELDQQSENDDNYDDDDDDPDYSYAKPSTSTPSRGSHSKSSTKCPSCNKSFANSTNMKCHYRVMHQQFKPYYCKWSKCDFVSDRTGKMIKHITVKHFKNRTKYIDKAKVYIGKYESSSLKDPLPPNGFTNPDFDEAIDVDCPHCNRNIHPSQFRSHLNTHENPGFRCKWHKCSFFFSELTEAKEHVCADHFQGQVETSNSRQVNQYLLNVDPKTGKTRKLQVRQRNSLISADHHSPPSTSAHHHSAVTNHQTTGDDESNSSVIESDDNEDNDFDSDKTVKSIINQISSFDCPKCEASFDLKHRLVRHYSSVHHEWKPYYCRWPKCDFVSGLHDNVVSHANRKHFNEKSREKARKYVAKRNETPPRDAVLEQIVAMNFGGGSILNSIDVEESSQNSTDHHYQPMTSGYHLSTNLQATSNESDSSELESDDNENEGNSHKSTESNTKQPSFDCPKCESSFDLKYLLVRHYRGIHQEWKPFYCRWPKCTFVAGLLDNVVKHADRKHFNKNNRRKARKYVAKREGTPPRDPELERIIEMKYAGDYRNANLNEDDDESNLKSTTFNLNCPKCNRNFLTKSQFMQHFRTHANSGFRCTWHNCGAFYSQYKFAKKHLLMQHFKDKLVNEIQITKHLVKVDPSLDMQNRDCEQ